MEQRLYLRKLMNIMKKAEYEDLVEELEDILNTMEIPALRRKDFRWLGRNIGILNGHHPKIDRACEILDILLKGEEL